MTMQTVVWFPERPTMCWLAPDVWRLTHDYVMPVNGEPLTIPVNFVTDLASVPGPFRSLIDEQKLGASAIGHDFLYQNGGHYGGAAPLKRRKVDNLFLRWMRIEGVPVFKRRLAWIAVRVAGWACWHRGKKGTRRV